MTETKKQMQEVMEALEELRQEYPEFKPPKVIFIGDFENAEDKKTFTEMARTMNEADSTEDVQKNIRGVDNIRLVRGWVPTVLDEIEERDFAFAYVDMDQYDSTLAALRWLETRMVPGGIICCDDWIEGRDWLAGGAINEFAKSRPLTGTCGREAWFEF